MFSANGVAGEALTCTPERSSVVPVSGTLQKSRYTIPFVWYSATYPSGAVVVPVAVLPIVGCRLTSRYPVFAPDVGISYRKTVVVTATPPAVRKGRFAWINT